MLYYLTSIRWRYVVSILAITNSLQAERPNIIFILADDLGWSELGCYGNRFNETPHIDRLAKRGIRYTNAYSSAPVCSPYRAALLTGQYPARIGILDYLRPDSENGLSTNLITFPKKNERFGIHYWHDRQMASIRLQLSRSKENREA
ncbi:MAG: hypothetical protein CBC27_01875 [Opitutia bacterium TMED67]|nr:hypothetical protein [Verrucomicrobiales bacterium]OUU75833.1 MAG: hypothetical protein CBC27_01875 [Opitutae bacterium TMED67]